MNTSKPAKPEPDGVDILKHATPPIQVNASDVTIGQWADYHFESMCGKCKRWFRGIEQQQVWQDHIATCDGTREPKPPPPQIPGKKRHLVKMTTYVVVAYREEDDKNFIEFHLNESSHCCANEFTAIAEAVEGMEVFCGCPCTTFEWVREANDEENAIDLTNILK